MTLALFIAGTGTEVGKTHLACGLIKAARARQLRAAATKPVMSGVDEAALAESDAGRLLAALGHRPTAEGVAKIAPWRFRAPLAPTAAARKEGRALPYAEVLAFCRERMKLPVDLHLLEAAGGVLSPIAEEALAADLAEDLELPALLVGGDRLGAMSHILTALEALAHRGIPVPAVVVNEPSRGGLGAAAIVEELSAFLEPGLLFPWRHGQAEPSTELLDALKFPAIQTPASSRGRDLDQD